MGQNVTFADLRLSSKVSSFDVLLTCIGVGVVSLRVRNLWLKQDLALLDLGHL